MYCRIFVGDPGVGEDVDLGVLCVEMFGRCVGGSIVGGGVVGGMLLGGRLVGWLVCIGVGSIAGLGDMRLIVCSIALADVGLLLSGQLDLLGFEQVVMAVKLGWVFDGWMQLVWLAQSSA